MANATRHGMSRRKCLKGVGTATMGWPVVTTFAKPMAMNTYKLDLARGLIVRAFQQVA